jgi:endonuclease/exonuclease/phosphatase (EEP) superfamily protein YafD
MGALLSALLWAKANWKVVLFALVLAALSFTGWRLYEAGKDAANQQHQIETLQANLAASEAARKLTDAALLADQQKAAADAIAFTELQKRKDALHDYAESISDGLRECLSGADVERLRNLWN